MNHLEALAEKYGTDKLQHGYIPFYEKHLPKSPRRILEIGVKQGASIRVWRDYFPNAEIHGLDLFMENDIDSIRNQLEVDRFPEGKQSVFLWKGNQLDYLVLEELRKQDFDVIIDDGSHNSRDQMMTFFGLFNGKQYYIEDLQCCSEEFYRQGLPYEATAAGMFNIVKYNNMKIIQSKNIALMQCI